MEWQFAKKLQFLDQNNFDGAVSRISKAHSVLWFNAIWFSDPNEQPVILIHESHLNFHLKYIIVMINMRMASSWKLLFSFSACAYSVCIHNYQYIITNPISASFTTKSNIRILKELSMKSVLFLVQEKVGRDLLPWGKIRQMIILRSFFNAMQLNRWKIMLIGHSSSLLSHSK